MIGKEVIVRTYSAGVHFGTLESRNGKEVVLKDARRIWDWVWAQGRGRERARARAWGRIWGWIRCRVLA